MTRDFNKWQSKDNLIPTNLCVQSNSNPLIVFCCKWLSTFSFIYIPLYLFCKHYHVCIGLSTLQIVFHWIILSYKERIMFVKIASLSYQHLQKFPLVFQVFRSPPLIFLNINKFVFSSVCLSFFLFFYINNNNIDCFL